jgi:hypothetical protein
MGNEVRVLRVYNGEKTGGIQFYDIDRLNLELGILKLDVALKEHSRLGDISYQNRKDARNFLLQEFDPSLKQIIDNANSCGLNGLD